MSAVRRYAASYWLMLRNSLIREMSFKANFLLWLVVEALWFVGQLVFVGVIYGYTKAIGDWTKWEVVLLISTHQLIAQTFQAFFYMNLSELPELVRSGRLDLMLTLPMDAQFSVSARKFSLDSLAAACLSLGLVGYALMQLGVVPTVGQVACYVVACGLGMAIHYAVLFTLATLSFWIVKAQGLVYGYYNLFNIGRYPDQVFRGFFKVFFTWVIPVILVANVPARLMARVAENPWPGIGALALGAAVTLAASRMLWTYALRNYTSASS